MLDDGSVHQPFRGQSTMGMDKDFEDEIKKTNVHEVDSGSRERRTSGGVGEGTEGRDTQLLDQMKINSSNADIRYTNLLRKQKSVSNVHLAKPHIVKSASNNTEMEEVEVH